MKKILTLVFASLILYSHINQVNGNVIEDFIKKINFESTDTMNQVFQKLISGVLGLSTTFKSFMEIKDSDVKPYYRFIPEYKATVIPNKGPVSWQGGCFKNSQAEAKINDDGSVTVTLNLQDAASLFCSDFYLIGTLTQFNIPQYLIHGTHTLQFKVPAKESEIFDLHVKGIRIFKFIDDPLTTLKYVVATAELFTPVLFQGVPEYFANLNRDFLKYYTGIDMQPRKVTKVEIDESLIHSGDHFAIIRLDGLDPMITYGMGSATGHVTMAIRREGKLMVCEAQAKDAYWPINAVQCNPYQDWLALAEKADYNLVWVPLSDENRAKFNETAANAFIDKMLGIDYGYEVLLTGWIDTLDQNYPCLPPEYNVCLTPELTDVLFSTLERLIPVTSRIWTQAMNQRVNLKGEKLPDIYYEAYKLGIDSKILPTLPEQDGWIYNTTRYDQPTQSPVMICNVFACNVWKAAGLFGDKKINCGEFSVWDSYKINIFQKDFQRPQQCIDADPENPLCQLLGKYSLRLDNTPGKIQKFNYVEVTEHMTERCPSKNPDYVADPTC